MVSLYDYTWFRQRGDDVAKSRRMTIEFGEETYQMLAKLAEANHTSMTEIVREGLALRKFAEEQKKAGKSLAVVDGDVIETKILLA